MLLILSLLAADPAAMMKVAAARTAAMCDDSTCGRPARSPYRLEPNIAGPADGKADALAVTGSQCAITGPKLCTKKQRTIYAATY